MSKSSRLCLFVAMSLFASLLIPRLLYAGPSISPSSISFGSVTLGTATASLPTLTFTNYGRQSITILQVTCSSSVFVVSGPALPLVVGSHSSVTFGVSFAPTTAGTYTGAITFTTTFKNNNVLSVSVSGIATAATPTQTYLLYPSIASIAFGKVLVGASSSQTLLLSNTGNSSVSISGVSLAGSSFSLSGFSGPVSLAAGRSLSLVVSCAPTYVGSYTGSINVTSNATNSPATVSLGGTGVQPAISVVPTSVSFSNVPVGVTNSQTVTIFNPGTANLTVSQASLVGSGFSYSGLALPLTIAPGASSPFSVAFTPTSPTTFSATLTLSSNASTSSLNIPLSGTSTSPTLVLSAAPTSLTFPTTSTGTASASQMVTLSNTGNSAVSISQVTATTNFTVSGIMLPISLSAGQSTAFNVFFAPTTTGSLSGTVTVTSSASNSPTPIKLSGSGATSTVPPVNLTWTPSSSTYAGFDIYRGTVSGGPYAMINSSLTPSFTDTTVTSGQTYYYVVTEIDTSGNQSTYSNEATAVIP